MKTFCPMLLLISFLLSACSSVRQSGNQISNDPPSNPIQPLSSQIDSVLGDSLLSPAFIGIKIVSLDNGNIIYERNSKKLFHPASNMKLLTTATALHLLDKDFQFRTGLFMDSIVQKGVLNGNLYVKGMGDPLFKTEDIDSLAKSVRQRGIQEINGDIIGDVTYFDSLSWGAGWMWDDEPDADEAFITPLTVNGNAIQIIVAPGRSIGNPVNVSLEPNTEYVSVSNFGVTSSDTLIPPLTVTRNRGENHVIVRGRMLPLEKPKQFTLSVRQPEMYLLTLLKERLLAEGVSIKGKIAIDTVQSNLMVSEISHPIDSVISRCNKESDNIAAENLLKSMASEKLQPPGSAVNGLSLVREYLLNAGIDTSRVILFDGSGVSWYNAISPDEIVDVLQKEFNDKSTFRRFFESLPIAGVDGTLKNQMNGSAAEGKVHAKTGTLTGASGLSGYITTADNRLLAFSILGNHFPGKVSVLRKAQNKIMELRVKFRSASQ